MQSSTLLYLTIYSVLASALVPQAIISKPLSSCRYNSYIALGDSYSNGYGSRQLLRECTAGELWNSTSCTRGGCRKDTGGYPLLFAQQHGIKKVGYLACNGNDTGSVLGTQINGPEFGDVDLVTVTMGGDNNSFFATVGAACVRSLTDGPVNQTECNERLDWAQKIVDNIDYHTVVKTAYEKAKSATIVLMGYPRIFTSDSWTFGLCSKLIGVTEDSVKRLNNLSITMNERLKNTTAIDKSRNPRIVFQEVDSKFDSHRVCDGILDLKDLAWGYFRLGTANGTDTSNHAYNFPASLHPTYEGIQKTYLKALNEALGCPPAVMDFKADL